MVRAGLGRKLAIWSAIAGAYLLTAWLAKLVALPTGFTSAFWPPAGIALVAVMLGGAGVWPAIWLGCFLHTVIYWGGPGGQMSSVTIFAASAVVSTGAVLQAQLGAWLLARSGGFRSELDDVGGIFRLILLGGVLACTVNASVGTAALWLSGLVAPNELGLYGLTWWAGDAIGVALIAPALLVWLCPQAADKRPYVAELLLWVFALVLISAVSFGVLGRAFPFAPLAYWAALRFSPRLAMAMLLAITGVTVGLTAEGIGTFAALPSEQALPTLNAWLVSTIGSAIVLIAVLASHRRVEQELRRSSLLFTSIVENNPDMIFVKEAKELRFVLFNTAGERVLGYPRSAMLGKNDYDMFPESQAEFFIEKDRETLRTGRLTVIPEEPIDTAYGLRYLQTQKVPILDDAGEPLYLLGISKDVTELKAAQARIGTLDAQLAERVDALEAANEELEAFTYSVSHDLRAPVRAIDGFAQALRDDHAESLDERGQRYLTHIEQCAGRLGMLIDDMLELTRVSRRDFMTTRVDLTELAREIAEELGREAPSRDVTWAIEPGLSATGDEGLLRIALTNLLGNAWKFTSRQATAHITVGAARLDGKPGFFVRDDGAGFDMAYADKLFRPFSRLHTDEEFEGTGIGLATVARVVRRHGGKISAEGAPEHGATFSFTLGEGPV